MSLERTSHDQSLQSATFPITPNTDHFFRSAALVEGVTSRQQVIEPLLKDYSLRMASTAANGLELVIAELDTGPLDYYVDLHGQLIAEAHDAIAVDYPLLDPDKQAAAIHIGVRLTDRVMTIYRAIALMEGHNKVSPLLARVVHGYAEANKDDMADKVSAISSQLRSQ